MSYIDVPSNIKPCILMATYNGGQFLSEQIESIRAQTYKNWMLLIRDDGSTDESIAIIKHFCSLDNRIYLITDQHGSTGSAQQNFSAIMKQALETTCEYFYFSDQDDVWHKTKIIEQLHSLLQMPDKPRLVHHDLCVVDRQLKQLHSSLIELLRLQPNEARKSLSLSRNTVTGCSMACNRKLLELAYPVPEDVIMHDWWLAQIAIYCGTKEFISSPLVDYRQHDSNTIGARTFWTGLNPKTNWIRGWSRGNKEFKQTIIQAERLHNRIQEHLADREKIEINTYRNTLYLSRIRRVIAYFTYRLLPQHPFLKLTTLARLITIGVLRRKLKTPADQS